MAKISASELLKNKKAVFIIALAIAIIFWFAITLVENPNSERTISNVSITYDPNEEIGDGLVGIGYEGNKFVSVEISGPSYIVNSVSSDDILVKAVLDETVGNAGQYSFKLVATNNSAKKFTIKTVTPKKMTVEYDKWIDKAQFSLSIKLNNVVVADNLACSEADSVFTNSSDGQNKKISISGPEQKISKIESVKAVVEGDANEKLTDKKVYSAAIKLYDKNDKEIEASGLVFEYETIDVTVPVYATKEVSIGSYINKPSQYNPDIKFYANGDKEITKIKIKGSPSVINDIEYIPFKEPIDFREVKNGSGEFVCELDIPDSILLVDDIGEIKVEIDTSSLTTKTLTVSKSIILNNTDSNGKDKYKIKVESLKVQVCGENNVLNNLSASDLRIKIDVDGKLPGKHELDATIVSVKSDNIWQLSKYTAIVTISE